MTAIVNVLFVLIILAGGNPPTPPPPFPPVWPPTDPLTHTVALPNADFESGLVGWQTWSEETGKPADASTLDYAIAPFFSVEHNPLLVHSGQASLHVGRIYDPWHAGLKRSINVPPGAKVQFCIDGRLYASNRDFGHESSWSSLDGHMQVGIYSDGEADWNASGIVWSEAANPHDEWQPICVQAVAGPDGRITLFTSTNYRGVAAKHLDAWWDDAELTIAGGDSPIPSNGLFPSSSLSATQPISVLLLIPAQTMTTSSSTFVVLPAQVYMSTQGMTLSIPAWSNLLPSQQETGIIPTPVILPTTIATAESRTDGQLATGTPTPKPTSPSTITPMPTATATAQAVNTPRPAVSAVSASPTASAKSTAMPTVAVAESMPIVNSSITPGLVGLGVLLIGGIGAALVLIRRR